MIIGDRLRTLREQKKLSQGDIEKRSGLLRAYLSRVENGYTIPSIETLEKWAKALDVPMYQFFYEGEKNLNHRLFEFGSPQTKPRGATPVMTQFF
jgi:transcriptional regulator with XRE-family HTH domain